MSIGRVLRTVLLLTPALLLFGGGIWFFTRIPGSSTDAPSGDSKLLVIVVFDQMRGDYVTRWATTFGSDGFEKMKAEGTWYSDCTLPFACSATGPGHASIASGATPSVHGITENAWYDRAAGKMVFASSSDQPTTRVPAVSGDRSNFGMAPTKLLAPTLSDALKAATNGNGRFFSLSLKDRSAVLLGGKAATGVYCFDSGDFHTSSYYRATLPPWVEAFNRGGTADQWGGKTWDRLGDAAVYDKLAGPDDTTGEGKSSRLEDRVFPHRLPAGGTGEYYSALEDTPYGNDLLWAFAKAAMQNEKLGTHGTRDVLAISFSSNDRIGHLYGPDSHEVLDVTSRSDRLIGEMIKHLDETIGRERYTLIVTSDHGIGSLPEVAKATHPEAKRTHFGVLVNGLDAALDNAFGPPDGIPGRWVEGDFKETRPWVYLNRRMVDGTGIPIAEVENFTRKWLANRPDAMTAFSRSQLMASGVPAGLSSEEHAMFDAVKLGFHPDRCGDVYILVKPYVGLQGLVTTGVDHGSVHDYDRSVPLLAFGAGVPKLGKQPMPMSLMVVAPLASKVLGMKPPEKALEKLPAGW